MAEFLVEDSKENRIIFRPTRSGLHISVRRRGNRDLPPHEFLLDPDQVVELDLCTRIEQQSAPGIYQCNPSNQITLEKIEDRLYILHWYIEPSGIRIPQSILLEPVVQVDLIKFLRLHSPTNSFCERPAFGLAVENIRKDPK